MKILFRVSPLLTLACSLSLVPRLSSAQEVVDEDVVDEDVVAEEDVVDEDVVDEDVVADEDVIAEEVVEDEVIADDESIQDDGAVEEGLFEPGEEPWRPAPAGKGVIWGRLVDEESGEPALEAQIKAVGTGVETYTDFDGYYRLELPPGTYTLSLFYELYEPATLGNIGVQTGVVSRVDHKMTAQQGAIEEEIIEDEAETQTVEGLALARQRSVSQGDAIGREEISKGTDSNAAQAAQRVVGATIVGDRFVYVRGLGERYSNSLLSGYPIPSPEPDRAAVPLDVFPAAVLDSLTIAKTFTPDMPADFAGGSVRIETRSVPKEPLFKIGLSGGLNTQATFRDRLTYDGSATDFLGFDNGKRSLPSSVPENQRVVGNNVSPGSTLSEDDVARIGRDLNSDMVPKTKNTPINHGGSIVAGNTWTFGGQAVGVLASANYSREYENYEGKVLKEYWQVVSDPRGFSERADYRVDESVEKVRLGLFGKVSYIPHEDHKIMLTGLRSQLSDDTVREFAGGNIQTAGRFRAAQLDWVERGMTFGMLSGRHMFRSLNRAELGWDASIAGAYRSQPDRRSTVYQYNSRLPVDPTDPRSERTEGWQFLGLDESGRHFYAHQTETSTGGKVDWTQPLFKESEENKKLDLKFGGLVNVKDRTFEVRRLAFRIADDRSEDLRCLGQEYTRNCPDKLFTDDNLSSVLYLQENPNQGDFYDAHLNVYAAYGMVDWIANSRMRLATGARVEWTDQGVQPLNPLNVSGTTDTSSLKQADFLPALSLIFSGTEVTKTRLSYTRTLARPQVREIAPFGFSDYFGGQTTTGNPNLNLTKIDNFDARFEYWPSLTEVMAVSVFYKYLQDPIERTLLPSDSAPQVTFFNADFAHLIGLELEARKNLGFIAPALNNFALNANLTVTYSRTEVPQTGNLTITSLSRSLVNQAPWVVNAALDYENKLGTNARLAYNINGSSLFEVGTGGVPDDYLHPFHSLDFAIGQKFLEHFTAGLQIENLVNDDRLWTQGKKVLRDDDGRIDNSNVIMRYREGRTISLSVSYEY